jgi:hypothetical protein
MTEDELREELARRDRALHIASDNLLEFNQKNAQLVDTLTAALGLIDQLLTEVRRLCGAASEPPPLHIFAAKKQLDDAMKKLLKGDQPNV